MLRFSVATIWLWLAGALAALADPAGFVDRLSADMATAAGQSVQATEAVIDGAFDIDAMAFAALPEWARDRADRGYLTAYKTYFASRLVAEYRNSGEGGYRILGTRENGALTLVGTEVTSGARRGVVEFYLRDEGESYRVVNLAIEGILVTAQQQKDFQPVLISGDIPGLTAFLIRGGAE
ncbi:MAG: ABC transporter substrate-binding protein [Pseudomonadota bacterium]|nr:ABC transporter substrate-binding protein [Pseudomonadota bacterium]